MEDPVGCQNELGNNALALGGTAGYCDHIGAMKEYQGDGSPPIHGSLVLNTVYQFSTLQKIADLIEQDYLSVAAIQEFHMHICR